MASSEEDIREQVETEASNDLIKRLAERLGATANAKAVFGDPVERNGVTVVPVARARWGIGGGTGKDKKGEDKGTGVGGGVQTTAVGYIQFDDAGVSYKRINDPLRYMLFLPVMPIVAGVMAVVVMLSAAAIALVVAKRTATMVGSVRLPFPRLTFHS
jgi:uncharacterized spore protein YtfJ